MRHEYPIPPQNLSVKRALKCPTHVGPSRDHDTYMEGALEMAFTYLLFSMTLLYSFLLLL